MVLKMECKIKVIMYNDYYEATLFDSIVAFKILLEILEDEKNVQKNMELKKNEFKKK